MTSAAAAATQLSHSPKISLARVMWVSVSCWLETVLPRKEIGAPSGCTRATSGFMRVHLRLVASQEDKSQEDAAERGVAETLTQLTGENRSISVGSVGWREYLVSREDMLVGCRRKDLKVARMVTCWRNAFNIPVLFNQAQIDGQCLFRHCPDMVIGWAGCDSSVGGRHLKFGV